MKKTFNNKFKITKKGYDTTEVEAYIKAIEIENDSLQNQLLTVSEIKTENERLNEELKDVVARENEVKRVLAVAVDKANEIKTDIKLQYALEIERLKIFQAKWTNAYEEIKERYHFDKDVLTMEGIVTDTAVQLEQLLHKDFGIKLSATGDEAEKQFKEEVDRLQINQDEINKLVEKLKTEIKKVS